MKPLSKDQIIRAVADQAAKRVCRRAVAALQKMRHTLSGDDSELKTTWDEICVQAQGEESMFWDAYESAMRDALAWPVSQLAEYELEALWLQTREGEDWDWKNEDEREATPVCNDDVVQHLIREHLMALAGEWTNPRIRAFLDRASLWD